MDAIAPDDTATTTAAAAVVHTDAAAGVATRVDDDDGSDDALACDAIEEVCPMQQSMLSFSLDAHNDDDDDDKDVDTRASVAASDSNNDDHDDDDDERTVRLHVAVQYFTDYVWLIVSEASHCVPGVVLRHAASPVVPLHASLYTDVAASVDCEVLLGMRDHTLTNVLASALVRAMRVRACEHVRSLLLCIHVRQTATRLCDVAARTRFVAAVQQTVLRLAEAARRA